MDQDGTIQLLVAVEIGNGERLGEWRAKVRRLPRAKARNGASQSVLCLGNTRH